MKAGISGRYVFILVGRRNYLLTWPSRDPWRRFGNGSRWRSGWQRTHSGKPT